jgi:hypothetical protein
MLRTLLAALAITVFAAGSAWAVDDATSESDAIELDQNSDPASPDAYMQGDQNNLPDPGEAVEMNESGVINE